MPSHTVHVVQRMAPGGLEVLAMRLAAELPGRNTLLSLDRTKAEILADWPLTSSLSRQLVCFEKQPGVEGRLVFRLSSWLRANSATAVVTHHIGPLLYGGVAARMAGVRRVVHVEHDVWHYESGRRRRLARAGMAIVRPRIVAISPALQQPLKAIFPGRDVTVVANGVDASRFSATREDARKRLGLPLDARIIGSAGRLETVKGHDILVEAAASLPDDVLIVIAGDGSQRPALESRAAALSLSSRFRFLGHRDDMDSIYPAFDIFCLPSRAEGLPLAILESQAAGVPVVATDVGDVAHAVCPASGKVVPPADPLSLAIALFAALKNPARVSPRQFVEDHFNWRSTIAGYSKLIGV